MKNTKVTLLIAAVAFFSVGCASTLTLGPQANKDTVIGASLSTESVGVTLPLVSAEAKATGTATKKK